MVCLSDGCGTVDLGDSFVPPDVTLSDDFFYCQVQPMVLAPRSCASGGAGEAGECHSARSALRLNPAAETDMAPECDGNTLIGTPPPSYEQNLEAIRFTVQSEPLASPLYRRPLQLDSHPRQIFSESDADADIIVQWITSGSMP